MKIKDKGERVNVEISKSELINVFGQPTYEEFEKASYALLVKMLRLIREEEAKHEK